MLFVLFLIKISAPLYFVLQKSGLKKCDCLVFHHQPEKVLPSTNEFPTTTKNEFCCVERLSLWTCSKVRGSLMREEFEFKVSRYDLPSDVWKLCLEETIATVVIF